MNKINDRSSKLRYNLLTTIVYIIGIILLIQLFNLQIIHGEEYRETSNTRLTRESVLRAARGSIRIERELSWLQMKQDLDWKYIKQKQMMQP